MDSKIQVMLYRSNGIIVQMCPYCAKTVGVGDIMVYFENGGSIFTLKSVFHCCEEEFIGVKVFPDGISASRFLSGIVAKIGIFGDLDFLKEDILDVSDECSVKEAFANLSAAILHRPENN